MIELSVKHIPFPFPKRVHAVTLFPFIIYEHQVRYDEAVQAHERYHWEDQKRWFVIPWFIIYVSLLPFYGGFRKHPFERPAYAIQDEVNAKKKKKSH
tara:strand:+ start:4549 stop:4839 length:291 start_codon:yes stop_codon:yes gene_type:complete